MAVSADLKGKRIAILATHGFEESELMVPREQLRAAGAQVDVVSPEAGEIRGWNQKDWGKSVAVDRRLADANLVAFELDRYDAGIARWTDESGYLAAEL